MKTLYLIKIIFFVSTLCLFTLTTNAQNKQIIFVGGTADVSCDQDSVLLDSITNGNSILYHDVSDYSKGIYYIKLQIGNKIDYTKMVIH